MNSSGSMTIWVVPSLYGLFSWILVVRLRQPNRHRIHHRIIQAMAQFTEAEWPGLLVVMRDVAQSVWRSHGNGTA